MLYYILEDRTPKPVDDMMTWAEWINDGSNKIVKRDIAVVRMEGKKVGEITVSTVFLGIDHNLANEGSPILFETMVFGGPLDQEMDRCSTWESAEKMHQLMIERVKNINFNEE